MDQMDIDHVEDVPDTPDRLTGQNANGKSILGRRSNLSVSGFLGNRNVLDGASKTVFKVNDNGVRKFLESGSKSANPPSVSFQSSSSNFELGHPSSSNNSYITRMVTEDIPNHERNQFQPTKNVKKIMCTNIAALEGGPIVDTKERNGHIGACKKKFPFGAPGNSRAEQTRKKVPLVIRPSSSHSNASSPLTSRHANKGKEAEKSGSGLDQGNMITSANNTHHKVGNGKIAPTSLSLNTVHRVIGQKRLVRNGCISPLNIARAKESIGKEKRESDALLNLSIPVTSSSQLNNIGEKEWIGNDLESLTSKGKGVMHTPSTVKKQVALSTHPPSRNSVSIREIVKEVADIDRESFRSSEELVGWRSTRNRSKLPSLPSPRENWHHPSEKGVHLISESPTNMVKTGEAGSGAGTSDNHPISTRSRCKFSLPSSRENWHHPSEKGVHLISGSPTNMVKTGEAGSGAGTSDNNPMDLDATSSQNASLPPERQGVFHCRPELGQFIGHHPTAHELTKRPKQRLTSSRNGECPRAALDSSDVVLIGASGNAQRTNETRIRNRLDSVVPVIEIDETSPAARGNGSSNPGSNRNDTSALEQIEADEILARELQDQLYNEVPSVAVGEMDAHLGMALQQGYDLSPSFSSRRIGSNARRSSMASSSRNPHSSSSPILSRRGYQSRAPTVNRMTRLRNRFPGRPRTLSSVRERDSLFPADMDVDLRMYILEALEAIDDMGVENSLLQTQRDFNENDYEVLLALDENNHQHGGASVSLINGLPQSTVQSDNFEEVCAICLDTPSMGDIIRHLPCLHKFHKECIDPWLRRKTSCPVCKSSIT